MCIGSRSFEVYDHRPGDEKLIKWEIQEGGDYFGEDWWNTGRTFVGFNGGESEYIDGLAPIWVIFGPAKWTPIPSDNS